MEGLHRVDRGARQAAARAIGGGRRAGRGPGAAGRRRRRRHPVRAQGAARRGEGRAARARGVPPARGTRSRGCRGDARGSAASRVREPRWPSPCRRRPERRKRPFVPAREGRQGRRVPVPARAHGGGPAGGLGLPRGVAQACVRRDARPDPLCTLLAWVPAIPRYVRLRTASADTSSCCWRAAPTSTVPTPTAPRRSCSRAVPNGRTRDAHPHQGRGPHRGQEQGRDGRVQLRHPRRARRARAGRRRISTARARGPGADQDLRRPGFAAVVHKATATATARPAPGPAAAKPAPAKKPAP